MSKKINAPGYDDNRYEVITQDAGDGDVWLPIPPELMSRMRWKPDELLDVKVTSEGKLLITKHIPK